MLVSILLLIIGVFGLLVFIPFIIEDIKRKWWYCAALAGCGIAFSGSVTLSAISSLINTGG